MMYIENDFLRVVFSDMDGSLLEISNKKTGTSIVLPVASAENFRLYIPLPDDWANVCIGRGHKVDVERISETSLRFLWSDIRIRDDKKDIQLRADVWLEGDELLSQIEIENNSQMCVDYVWYPILGGVERLGDDKDDLIHAGHGGVREKDFLGKTWLEGGISCHWNRYWYTSREFRQFVYPVTDMMQWIALVNQTSGLYLSSRDNRDFYTGFYAERERENTPITFSIAKACFVDYGENYKSPINVVSLYSGSWHVAAKKYRDWMNTWFKRDEQAKWIEEFDGWLSLQSHVGDMHIRVPYSDYPKWLDNARMAGLNTLHIHCGLHDEGIEGGYPYWSNFSERMGGEKELKRVIDEIHKKGGKIVTFTKENKVNLGLPEYDEKFKRHANILRDGGQALVCYPTGTLDMLLSGAVLANMCRADKEWHQFILNEMDIVASTGVDGNMIDEWCSGPFMCFSKQHGHRKPYETFKGQLELGRKIKEVSKKHREDFMLAGEEIWDASYEFMDVSFARGYDDAERFYELYRTSLPWLKKTAEILENCYEHLNYAFSCGYIFALTLDYYHGTPEDYPEFTAYFREIIRIRQEARRFFNQGEFLDNTFRKIEKGNELVKHVSYTLNDDEFIILRNESDTTAKICLSLSGASGAIIRTPQRENVFKAMPTDMTLEVFANSITTIEVLAS